MKISNPLRILFAIIAFSFCINIMFAQEETKKERVPYDQFGAGLTVGYERDSQNPIYGVEAIYAIAPNMHAGATIGLFFDGGLKETATQAGEDSKTYLYFAPYFKYMFTRINYFTPFIQGSFVVSSTPKLVGTGVNTEVKTNTSAKIAAGGEWFPYKQLGVQAGIQLLWVDFDPFRIIGGVGPVYMGIEWFF